MSKRSDGIGFWQKPVGDLMSELASQEKGLSDTEAATRLDREGPNEIASANRKKPLREFLARLGNPLVLILLVAAAIAGLTGDIASFVIIFVIVLMSTVLDMVQQGRAQATAEALRRSIALTTRVRRDGTAREIPVREIVPGDIIELSAGDLVPADGVVLSANMAQVNQAALTGEPYPVAKRPETAPAADVGSAHNVLLSGSSVIGGTAVMLVTATGAKTEFGGIAASLHHAPPPTAFERGIRSLGMMILRMTVFLVLFVLLVNLVLGRAPLESFLFAGALAVGLTPELLPMIVTVALARGAQRMATKRVVVKRLSAIHDIGQMDVLCTDKTGTLTEAKIALVAHPGIDGTDSDPVADLAAVNALFETGLKSPLDEALIPRLSVDHGWLKLDERPFDFERRRVSVLAEKDGQRIEIIKGAPETVMSLCTAAGLPGEASRPFDEALRQSIDAMQEGYAHEGLRMLGVAWKDATGREKIDTDDDAGLTFAGLCVFVDPPKQSATSAIEQLEALGVRIKVISGDAGVVVRHLAGALNLPVAGVISGEEIATLDDAALAARVEDTDIFARVTPDQKLRIVRALQTRGHTVGFMGDGINDAPAIRAADVGLSVDDATDVAREAADMILLDPDLGVLTAGVAEGRRTYANIMKYIRMATSSNFGNMLTMALASAFLPFLPLTAVQVLLNNLIYDTSQIGIPFDRADKAETAKPCQWDMKGLVRFMLVMGPLSSVFDVLTFALLLGLFHLDAATFRAAWFLESMATQILVVFLIRSSAPLMQDLPHRALILSALIALCVAMALPFLPFAMVIGFSAPSVAVLGGLAGVVVLYLLAVRVLRPFAMRR